MRQAQMTRNERRYYRKKIIEQRLMGLGVLACCALVLWMCSTGVTVEDRDGTAVVLLAPLGLWLLFSKQILIYCGDTKMSERIFNVSRSTKTGKTVNVGDFPTVEQAQAAMLSHYKATPKRGDFRYRIFEEELEEINGVTFRKFCLVLSGGNKPYSKSYTPAELKALVESEA